MRGITIYPHGGRNYACGETVTIEDQWSLLDAFNHARHRGENVVNAQANEMNFGTVTSGAVPSRKIQTLPTGIVPSLLFFTQTSGWPANYAFEINPNFNAWAIEATIRLLTESEYNTINSSQSGQGWRGQVLRLIFTNDATLSQQYVSIYMDMAWYAANVGILPAGDAIDYNSLEGEGAKMLSLIIGMNGNMLQPTRANPAHVQARLWFPKQVNGNNWSVSTESTAFLPPSVHPVTGHEIQGAGLVDLTVTQFYLPSHTVTPTGGSFGLGRTVSRFSAADYPPMGTLLNAAQWSRATTDYQAARSIGFGALLLHGYNVGGVLIPMVGDRGIIVNEQAVQQFTRYVEIPANAKRAVVVGWIRTNAVGSMSQTLTVDLFKPLIVGQTNQVLLTESPSGLGGTAWKVVYADVALAVGIQPQTSDVERGWLVVKSTKTNPRPGTVGNPANPADPQFLQADGFFSLLVKFY